MRCTIPILTADLGNVSTRGVGVYLTSNRNSNKVGTDTGEKLAYKCKIMFVCLIVYIFCSRICESYMIGAAIVCVMITNKQKIYAMKSKYNVNKILIIKHRRHI